MRTSLPTTPGIRARVDDELLAFLAGQNVSLEGDWLPLLDELHRLVAAGGKRLRPVFCAWGHIAAGGVLAEPIARVAAALELLHTFAIVHDDVMDRSPSRRGGPSAHVSLSGDAPDFGVAAAILAGDLALVLSDRLLAESGFPAKDLEHAAVLYDRMRVQAIGGQYLDLVAARRRDATRADARRIARLKSGGYTVAFPLAIGATLAGAGTPTLGVLEAFGLPLGEAFQLRDDVLGVFGDAAATGKDIDGDLREGKQTYLIAAARDRATADQRRLLDDKLGDPDLRPHDAERVREAIRSSGALDETLALIASLAADATAALAGGDLDPHAADALVALADHVVSRSA